MGKTVSMDARPIYSRCPNIHPSNNVCLTGFTLVEILVSLAILGILAAISIPAYSGYVDRTRNETAILDIKTISLAIDRYYSDNGVYPDSLVQVNFATYRDPWGNPYRYFNIKTAKGNGQMRKDRFLVPINSDYDLYSRGKDGNTQPPLTAKASMDDIIRANDGAYIGPAYAF